jgi:outer membrane protein OmpA-like peptidoglycan-associated protein
VNEPKAATAATSTKATSSSRVNEPKAATAATSTKASSSSRVNEPKAATAATSTKASRNRNTSVVNFKNGSAELVDINDLKISLILDKLKSNSNLEITVEGYASSEGDLEFNINLSQKRADKYASYLVSQGVPKSNIKSIGKGIDNPIASNDTEEGRAQNRRVEVIIK